MTDDEKTIYKLPEDTMTCGYASCGSVLIKPMEWTEWVRKCPKCGERMKWKGGPTYMYECAKCGYADAGPSYRMGT